MQVIYPAQHPGADINESLCLRRTEAPLGHKGRPPTHISKITDNYMEGKTYKCLENNMEYLQIQNDLKSK